MSKVVWLKAGNVFRKGTKRGKKKKSEQDERYVEGSVAEENVAFTAWDHVGPDGHIC